MQDAAEEQFVGRDTEGTLDRFRQIFNKWTLSDLAILAGADETMIPVHSLLLRLASKKLAELLPELGQKQQNVSMRDHEASVVSSGDQV